MSDELTPGQRAEADQYIARYTAIGLRAVPEVVSNTRDNSEKILSVLRRLLDKSGVLGTMTPTRLRFVAWEDPTAPRNLRVPLLEWMDDAPGKGRHKRIKAGTVLPVPAKTPGVQADDHYYMIAANASVAAQILRLWTGTKNQSGHWLSGQLHAHVPAYARFISEVLGMKKLLTDVPTDLADDFVKCCGGAYICQRLSFVCPHLLGFYFDDLEVHRNNPKDGKLIPVWSDEDGELCQKKYPERNIFKRDGIWYEELV